MVPELSTNLLSVHSITENGGEVLFTKDKVQVKYNNKEIIKGHKMNNGSFEVKLKPIKQSESYLTDETSNTEQ